MSNERKTPKIENLELNRETVADLSEQEGEQARGGMQVAITSQAPTCYCRGGGSPTGAPSNNPRVC